MKKSWKELVEERTNEYFAKDNLVILSDYARYDYKEDGWKYAPDSFFASVINSNDADKVSEDEARKIVEDNGGKNFDSQDDLIVE
jgi:hypothetical protein